METKPTSLTFAERVAALRPHIEELSRALTKRFERAGFEGAPIAPHLGTPVDAQEGTGKREAAAKMAEGPKPPGKLTFKYVPIASLRPPTHLPDGREMSLSMQPDRKEALEGFQTMLAAVDALLATGVDIEMQIGVYGDPATMQQPLTLSGGDPATTAFLRGATSVNLAETTPIEELIGAWKPDPNIKFEDGALAKVFADHPELFSDDPFFRPGRG